MRVPVTTHRLMLPSPRGTPVLEADGCDYHFGHMVARDGTELWVASVRPG
jgi:hypothetical protein